jgi:hypothetical protein
MRGGLLRAGQGLPGIDRDRRAVLDDEELPIIEVTISAAC